MARCGGAGFFIEEEISMSRRYSSRTRQQPLPWDDTPQAHWAEVSWWYDPIPGFEPYTWAEWQDAFAERTLKVAGTVWRKEGARYYATQRDVLLREDLQDWLWTEAQNIAAKFMPSPWHPDPIEQWAAYLYVSLVDRARWHFSAIVGRRQDDWQAWNSHIDSTDRLDQRDAEDGRTTARHALHGHSFGSGDPLRILLRTEDFMTQLTAVEDHLRNSGQYSTNTSGTCLVNLCAKPVSARGLCSTHYAAERRRWNPETCAIPQCVEAAVTRGLCHTHYGQWDRGRLEAHLHQYVRAEKRKPGPASTKAGKTCSEDGCTKPVKALGMCSGHYQTHLAARQPPCSIEGCASRTKARGLCDSHYEEQRKKGVGA